MHVHFVKDGRELPIESTPWDDELNAGLIDLEVPAVDADQEADRFALGLRAALRKPSRDFGDGYFNSVLTDFLKNVDRSEYPAMSEALVYSSANAPSRDGLRGSESYRVCREMIADAITGRAHELRDRLRYPEDKARNILDHALARYLDERFSLTSRRQLGLL
ncbi:hypothetical protein [Aquisphaera insulae]|uniref:hypothetical protein n=1 Tax=Aquisphaera insulae TaxID=2712864 RepID=UPI0013EA0A52|nr:hypothetical protein [Aquisphaera insulae]